MTDISREALGKAIYTATARTLPDGAYFYGTSRDLIVIAEALRDRVDELEKDNSAQRNALNDRSDMLVAQENEIVALRDRVDELEKELAAADRDLDKLLRC